MLEYDCRADKLTSYPIEKQIRKNETVKHLYEFL